MDSSLIPSVQRQPRMKSMKRTDDSEECGGSTNGHTSPWCVPKMPKKFKEIDTEKDSPTLQNEKLMNGKVGKSAKDVHRRNSIEEKENADTVNEEPAVPDQPLLNGNANHLHDQSPQEQEVNTNNESAPVSTHTSRIHPRTRPTRSSAWMEENLHKKLDKLLKDNDPFSEECDKFFEDICLPLQRPNAKVNLYRAAIHFAASAKIFLAQIGNLFILVRDINNYIVSNPEMIDALETFIIVIQNGQNGLNSKNAATPSIVAAADQQREIDAEPIINLFHENETERQDSALVSQNQTAEVSGDGEHNRSQFLDHTAESMDPDRTGLESHEFSNKEDGNGHMSGFPNEKMNESTSTHQGTDGDLNSMHASGNETLQPQQNSEAETNRDNEKSMEVDEFQDHMASMATSTPLRPPERLGASAGTRQAASNSSIHLPADLLSTIKGTPSHTSKHRTTTKLGRRCLFGNGSTFEDATLEGDLSALHTGTGQVVPEETEVTVFVQGNPNNGEQLQPYDVLDFLHAFYRGQVKEPEAFNAALAHIRNLPVQVTEGQGLSNEMVAEVNTNFENNGNGIESLPPSELFRPTCDRNDNSGLTIMERTKEKNKKESWRRMNKIFTDQIGPLLRECLVKSAVYNCSAAALRNVTFFQDKMRTIFREGQPSFVLKKYEMAMLNIANSVSSEEKDVESQESGYASQSQQQQQELPEDGWFTFEQLIPEKNKVPTRQEIARSFSALTSLLSHSCLDIKFDSMREETASFEPIPSTSKNIPPPPKARYRNQNPTDVNKAHFKALELLPRSENFRLQESGLFPGTTLGRDDNSESEEEEFVQVEQVQYVGELFSSRSRKMQEKRTRKLAGNK